MRIRRLSVLIVAVGSLITGAGVASASTLVPAHSNGHCYGNGVVGPTGSFAGWCDGNGPQTYRAYVNCTNGHRYYGVQHWFGDRRGSTATCPAGINATGGSFDFPLGT